MKLLRIEEVYQRLGVSRVSFWRMRERGEFPQGIYLRPGFPKSQRWPEHVVDAWIKEKMGA